MRVVKNGKGLDVWKRSLRRENRKEERLEDDACKPMRKDWLAGQICLLLAVICVYLY